ncbi:UDP-glucoseglycoprotein glucosyltransferase precursor [Blumeria hordei DH14]|uniref:UDP-glucoseglycoprotein glucosyltransferase n=1 Tax=Blumeria graminis f. sp. hordei (strain DH14) TaxID=546991 RepID=N1JJ64_BLUG1|nr:UDP-glucoseglycoprotein glucosyltransferase precursor [Blumeria hordei DH14]
MIGLNLKYVWTGILLVTTRILQNRQLGFVHAGPSVNLELKTAFSSAPYLLELLETAAEENSTSYFPLLNRVADGYFADAPSDQKVYERFLKILQDDGHITEPADLSAYQLALSMRVSAPRIESHYQYYRTAPRNTKLELNIHELEFDRIFGNVSAKTAILYADITSPTFGEFHRMLMNQALDGNLSYRIRHKNPEFKSISKPISTSGWGVELALKSTDYIVIDDRGDEKDEGKTKDDKSENTDTEFKSKVKLDVDEVEDLRPLSASELSPLGVKAGSYIMQSKSPLDTLLKVTRDFPKYSSQLVSHNVAPQFLNEHRYNRNQLVPEGHGIIWMNGIQLTERQFEAFNLLDVLRKERHLISGIRALGLTAADAIRLVSHPQVSAVQSTNEDQRYDWRDEKEGGNAIIWMNNLEEDQRYAEWPRALSAMLQRVHPGQLPTIRRDSFNLVVPVDFSEPEDIALVVNTLLGFVTRRLCVRIGIVPITLTPSAVNQAKIIYHLTNTYGLQSAVSYLVRSSEAKLEEGVSSLTFDHATRVGKPINEKPQLSLKEVLESDEIRKQVEASKKWLHRLSAEDSIPPVFMDGVVIPRHDSWLQTAIFHGVFEEEEEDQVWLPSIFLDEALSHRNPLIIPESPSSLKVFDLHVLLSKYEDLLNELPRLEADPSSIHSDWAYIILIADLNSIAGQKLAITTADFGEKTHSIDLRIAHNPLSYTSPGLSDSIYTHLLDRDFSGWDRNGNLGDILKSESTSRDKALQTEAAKFWKSFSPFIETLGLLPGQNAILINGRLVGPISDSSASGWSLEDLITLLSFERRKRITPTHAAMIDLGLGHKIQNVVEAAKFSSKVALSTLPDPIEKFFEQPSTSRMNKFDMWKSNHTAIEIGNPETSDIQFTVILDPASHQGQRWVAILKVLSELQGVYMKLFLNPKERLTELPVKRFYRFVLESKPSFDSNGEVKATRATFKDMPQSALMTIGMDLPPTWLVAPKVSVHDLDNIKLSSVKIDVEAIYELEHILIEGHCHEAIGGRSPRGVQLVLGTERDAHVGDTIIMANLGYFQFKANPGYYRIRLQEGRSSEIFHIDSVGAHNWKEFIEENSNVIMMSFKGTTLFLRLSRRTGMETEDVLEPSTDSNRGLVSQGWKLAHDLFNWKGQQPTNTQADINIFSVASGHLYERMLNIMMVSVMKNTNHTVKFWFIEQFLSPSFKDFIPYLANQYEFQYEMVTYKWPHWLRAQTEKQREIWGYKILFLDVLFPLSLDKVIFVDADQIVRTDMIELVQLDLNGAPYGFTPMCDSRTEMEGFRFWKKGYWEKFLRGLPYHISALYVVDLRRFRRIAAGDRLRQQYHALSADPGSLANLDQDLPNHMQNVLPIHSLPQEWLWCETWCSDDALVNAKTIDLCNNPLTKEPKLDRARRQVPEWTIYDDEIALVAKQRQQVPREEDGSIEKIDSEAEVQKAHQQRDEL